MTQVASQTTESNESLASQILASATPTQPEAAKPEVTETQDDKISPKLQVLIKRERAAIERERAAKAKETEVAEALKEREALRAKVAEFETLKKTKPMEALALLGMNYQDLTQIALADGNVPPEMQIKKFEEKFDSHLKNQEMLELQRQEDAKKLALKQEEEATAEFKKQISSHLTQNKDRYEFITFESAEQDVYDLIDANYERTKNPETGIGEIWSIAEAADKVEQYLEAKYEKARNLNKVKTLLAPQPTKFNPADYKPKPQMSQMQKTLTNNLSATPAAPRTKILSDEERIQKAIAYAKGLRA